MENQYVIINNKEIHIDMVGEAIVGSLAHSTRKFGYFVCEICGGVVKKTSYNGFNRTAHNVSKRHRLSLKLI